MLTKTHLISFSALFISIFTAIAGIPSASIALIILIIAFQLKTYFNGGTCSIVKDLTGKVVIVTGARTGVGRETARALARMNATVILACRGLKTALPVLEELRADTKNDKAEMLELDLDDLQSIRRFAETFKSKYNRLDILINNAGVMAVQERKLTKHGYELQFGTNHLGHFYLTSLLLDVIKKSAPSRIINVSSRAQREGVMHWDDLMLKGNYTPWRAYRQSKLANVIFSKELQRRMDLEKVDVKVVSLHPGAVRTELGRHMAENPVLRYSYYALYLVYLYMTKSAMQGAQTTLYCALEDQDKLVGGEYYSDCKPSKVNSAALVEENGRKLWEASEKLIKDRL